MDDMLGSRLMIAEHQKGPAMDLERRVQALGYRVVGRAVSGPEALEKASRLRPELVLMDVHLDGPMDGIDAAHALRSEYDIPVVYITAAGDETTVSRAKATEPLGYVLKPYEDGDLRTTLAIAVSRRASEARLRMSERQLACMLGSLKDPTIATDLEGRITFMNSAAANLVGRAIHEGVGRPCREVFRMVDERTGDNTEFSIVDSVSRHPVAGPISGKLLLGPHGRRIALEDSATLMRDGTGCPIGIVIELRDLSERRIGELALRQQATTDDLTGLWNRRRFLEQLTQEIARSQRYGSPLCVALVDVDHFKAVNDTLGHDAGDRVLIRLSVLLREGIRDTDQLARLGGDEYLIALPETKLADAQTVLQRVLARIEREPFESGSTGLRLTVSIGLAAFDSSRHTVAGLIKASDMAAYRAKLLGRNCVAADPELVHGDPLHGPIEGRA
jgi:diguanylate cyclase (GGDEF)-like protein/PAS domain S-box-containing protein